MGYTQIQFVFQQHDNNLYTSIRNLLFFSLQHNLVNTHGRTPTIFPPNPAYKPFHWILLPPCAAYTKKRRILTKCIYEPVFKNMVHQQIKIEISRAASWTDRILMDVTSTSGRQCIAASRTRLWRLIGLNSLNQVS